MEQIENKYKPFPFWSWNDELEIDELIRQIDWMHDNGIGGFFMHARGGLTTPYLGEKWFKCVEACLKRAKELGMEGYAYDENGWPSGFVGGKLLSEKENLDTFITWSIGEYDPNSLVSYDVENEKLTRVTEGKNCLNLYLNYSHSTVDICNKEVVKKFIKLTHEEYKKHDIYGNLRGFFTDEPQYFRWGHPWTSAIAPYFKETYNVDILDYAGLLFVDKEGYRDFRFKFWKAMQTLMLNSFAKQVYEWCDKNNYKLTGHYVEENAFCHQLWCCGGIMPFYEYEHIPGIDWLGRNISWNDLAPKQLGSVCAQLGKEQAMAESFACAGWDATPLELRRIAQYLMVGGVNILCHHLLPYSEHGQRKRDYPEHYSAVNPWVNKSFKDFNDYFSSIGKKLSQSKEIVNIGLLNSLSSAYFDYRQVRVNGKHCAEHVDLGMGDALNLLGGHQLQYHIIDETLLEKHGSVEGNSIRVGLCKYDYIVMPKAMITMDINTEKVLREYVSNGGKILLLGDAPQYIRGIEHDYSYLKSNIIFDELLKSQDLYSLEEYPFIRTTLREDKDGNKFIFTVNSSDDTSAQFIVKGYKSFKEGEKVISTNVKYGLNQGRVLYLSNEEPTEEKVLKDLVLSNNFKVSNVVDNYLTIDKVSYSRDGINYSPVRDVMCAFYEVLKSRYQGKLFLKYTFDVEKTPAKLNLLIENMNLQSVKVNGVEVEKTGTVLEKDLFKYDIAKNVKTGINEIIAEINFVESDDVYYALFGENVLESIKNCLAYPTTIEAVYLCGDFGVRGNELREAKSPLCLLSDTFTIVEQKKEISDLLRDGFLFFRGDLPIEQEIEVDDVNQALYLTQRFHLVEVYVNDQFAGKMMFDNRLDLSKFLKIGKNKIKLVVTINNRNLLGPFHTNEEESFSVGPMTWERFGHWNDEGKAPNYKEPYAFVKTFLF